MLRSNAQGHAIGNMSADVRPDRYVRLIGLLTLPDFAFFAVAVWNQESARDNMHERDIHSVPLPSPSRFPYFRAFVVCTILTLGGDWSTFFRLDNKCCNVLFPMVSMPVYMSVGACIACSPSGTWEDGTARSSCFECR